MKTSNNKNRRYLHLIKDFIHEIRKITVSGIDFSENTQKLAVERMFEKIGETIKRLSDNIYTQSKTLKKYRNLRNKISHQLHIDIDLLKGFVQDVDLLEKEVVFIISQISHSNPVIQNFEEYSKFSTIEKRKQLTDALIDKITDEEEDKIFFPKSMDIENYSVSIENIIQNPTLLNLAKENPGIAEEITADILKWAKMVANHISKTNPYLEEEELLKSIAQNDVREFGQDLLKSREYIIHGYKGTNFDYSFYEQKLNEMVKNKKENITEQIRFLKSEFIETWASKLLEKKLKYEIKEIDTEREKFIRDLYRKTEQFKRLKELLHPFFNELGRLWDLSGGIWKKAGFEVLGKYATILEKDKRIKELAEELGKFRKTEQELEEEDFEKTILKHKWKADHFQKSEFVGVHESNDINHLLASETALLGDETTESIFFKKFAEEKLLTFQLQSRFLDTIEHTEKDTRSKTKELDKGPFIICVDTSGSMHGAPEYVAKVLCLAITKIAINEKRKCYLISFSTNIQTMDLADLPNSLDKLTEFLQMSFHGGTDVVPTLNHAIEILNTKKYKNADVLVISDFIMSNLSDEASKKIQSLKEKKYRFYSLTISKHYNNQVVNLFDHNWVYNPDNPNNMIELVKSIKQLRQQKNIN